MKARFTTEQPAVRWQPLDNGMVDVTICLNGKKITEENQQMVEKEQYITVTDTFWEYDFHQFREKEEDVNREAVEKNPEKYLKYEPQKEKTAEQKLREQEEQIEMLKDCLLEMSEAKAVYKKVPRLLKEKVKELVIAAGMEYLVADD